MQNGTSISYFPIKYEVVVYNFEFSSLKNTSLSTVNPKMVYITAPMVRLIQRKNKEPATENRLERSPLFSPIPQNTPPCSKPKKIPEKILALSCIGSRLKLIKDLYAI